MNAERIENKRAQLQSERATINALKAIVNKIVDVIGLDEEKMNRRIEIAMRSEYGRINGMVNLLAEVTNWPAEQGDGTAVGENRKVIEEKLDLDLMLLEDIRTYKGYHTFATDELETRTGVEPMYEDYEDFVAILLEDMGLTPGRVTISSDTWTKTEKKAVESTKLELERMRIAVERHKALMNDFES